jgi:hypothetical protein
MSVAIWIAMFIPIFIAVFLPYIHKKEEEKKESE